MRVRLGSWTGSETKCSQAIRSIPTAASAATRAPIRSRLTTGERPSAARRQSTSPPSEPFLSGEPWTHTAPERADEVRVPEVPRPGSLEQGRVDVVRMLLVQFGQLRPVDARLQVMDGVVAVVEQQRIEHRRDEVP